MNSSNRSQCDEADEIEYIGAVTPPSVKLLNSDQGNVHTYFPRKSLEDVPASIPIKSFANVNKNDSNLNPETISLDRLLSTAANNINKYMGYPPPPCTFSSIIILILINTEHKSLTYYHLRDIICELFPYYKKEDLYKKMIHRIAVTTTTKKSLQNKRQFFLKNLLERHSQSTLVMLNPAEENNWRDYVLHEIINNYKMKESMRKPELLPQLIQGLTKITIAYESGHPIITIIPSIIVYKSFESSEVAPVYHASNEIKEQREVVNDETLNEKSLGSIGSPIYNINESEDSLPDLSLSNSKKSSSDYSFKDEKSVTRPTVETLRISPSFENGSKISVRSSQSNNQEILTSLQMIQRENVKRKFSKTLYSSNECLLLCNKTLLNEHSKIRISPGRSQSNKDDHEIQQQSSVSSKSISLYSSNEVIQLHKIKTQNLPDMSQCVTMWQKIFPWMYYLKEHQIFICKTCNWSSCESSQVEVFKITSIQDVHSVAAKLRQHNKGDFHIVSTAKYEELAIQCKYQYQALKDHLLELSSEDDVINVVELMAGRKLYTMQSTISSDLTGMVITTRLLAEYIEDNLLNSLKKSSFFSVIAAEEKGYAIVRWLDSSLDPVEHLICSRLRFPDNNMSSLEYLERQQVNLSKLISYSSYPCMHSEFGLPERLAHFEKSASPFRIPTISECLEWLKKFTILRQIYLEVSFVCKIAKIMPHKFSRCPNAKILANVKDPNSLYIILEEEAMNIFLDNIKVLKDISRVIYTQTGNLEALGFNKSCCNYISIKRVISILVDIYRFLQNDELELSVLNKIRVRLHDIENNKLDNIIQEEKNKIYFQMENKDDFDIGKGNPNSAIGIIDMYISYVVLALSSPSTEIVEDHLNYCKCSKSEDVESVLNLLDTNSLDRLSPSIIEMRLLFDNVGLHANTILDIIKKIKDQPSLQIDHPLGWKLMQAVAVLPFLPAKVEQHMFSVATGEFSIMEKDTSMLLPALMYIMIEGPESQYMDEELVLSYWSNSWKNVTQS